MKIVEAKKSDLGSVTALYYQLYPDRKKPPLSKFNTPKLKYRILVAKDGKTVIGFILATFTSYSKSKFGYLEELIVDAKYRGRGIGSKLVKEALLWEKKLGAEVVFGTTDNEVAFYEKQGFRKPKKSTWLLWTPK